MTDPTVSRNTTSVPGPRGPVRSSSVQPNRPIGTGIVWIHGGGFRVNDIDVPEADWVSQLFAEAGITVVSVDYRLATDGVPLPCPERRLSGGLAMGDRGITSERRAHRLARGGREHRGDCAASVSLQARDGRALLPRTSVLVYPVLHSRFPDPSAELAAKLADLPPEHRIPPELPDETNLSRTTWETPELLTDPYAFPAYGQLEGLPPTLIINSDADLLRTSAARHPERSWCSQAWTPRRHTRERRLPRAPQRARHSRRAIDRPADDRLADRQCALRTGP